MAALLALMLLAGCSNAPPDAASSSTARTDADMPTSTSPAAATDLSTTPVPPPAQPSPASVDGMRGYFSPLPFWDQTFTVATSADCTSEGADDVDAKHAWRLPGTGLACSQGPFQYNDSWGGRVESVWLYFDPNTDAQAAIATVASILPADSQQVGSFDGVNADDSKYHDGSCKELIYASDALAAAVSQVNPQWKADPHKVSITLYSGNATDGADRPYQPGSVHLALIGLGAENRGLDGVVHC